MTYRVTHRYGAIESTPGLDSFPELLAELKSREDDEEHGSVSVTHESEWCIAVSLSGIVTFENLENGEPRHMKDVPESKLLELWSWLSEGNLALIELEPWQPGYEPPVSDVEWEERRKHAEELTLRLDRGFYEVLGVERTDVPCRSPDCQRGAIHQSVFCRVHHFESLRGKPCPFSD